MRTAALPADASSTAAVAALNAALPAQPEPEAAVNLDQLLVLAARLGMICTGVILGLSAAGTITLH